MGDNPDPCTISALFENLGHPRGASAAFPGFSIRLETCDLGARAYVLEPHPHDTPSSLTHGAAALFLTVVLLLSVCNCHLTALARPNPACAVRSLASPPLFVSDVSLYAHCD
jgi:hypothetical protein